MPPSLPSVQVPLAAARPGCFAPPPPCSLSHPASKLDTFPAWGRDLHLKLAALNTSAGRRKVATGFWKRSRALALSRSPTPTPPASSFPLGKGFVRRHCPGSRGFAGGGGGRRFNLREEPHSATIGGGGGLLPTDRRTPSRRSRGGDGETAEQTTLPDDCSPLPSPRMHWTAAPRGSSGESEPPLGSIADGTCGQDAVCAPRHPVAKLPTAPPLLLPCEGDPLHTTQTQPRVPEQSSVCPQLPS